MKVADYIAQFLSEITTHVFGVCGGGAMYLNDAIAHHPKLKWIATHHEQAASFAAEAFARVSNRIGVVHVTAGPGVTNVTTGVACAWADSLPMLVIAGQVDSKTLRSWTRQLGISEVDGPALMGPITKYAETVIEPDLIRYHLEKAFHLAISGRRGPVFLEIPLDVQNAEIDPAKLVGGARALDFRAIPNDDIAKCMEMIRASERPVMIIGNGLRMAEDGKAALDTMLVSGPQLPVLCSWGAADMISSQHPLYVGRPGLIGDRAANFAVQNADLVLAVGTRLSLPQIGHNWEAFAPKAKLIMVDIDREEIDKKTLRVDYGIVGDAGEFLRKLTAATPDCERPAPSAWLKQCRFWRDKFPIIDPVYQDATDGVHSYYFLEKLAEEIDPDAIVVTDVGTSFVGTMQAMPMSGTQRMFHSPGIAPMGYGLPAAVGACLAGGGRQVICLTGDGGTMFNLQELQTIRHHNLPIKIFLYANRGYKTMQVTQDNHFQRESVSSPSSDVSWPNFMHIAAAFGVPPLRCAHSDSLDEVLDFALHAEGPVLVELEISKSQTIAPLVKTRVENGKLVPGRLEDMWPHVSMRLL